jgi:hypothetical protein
VLRDREAHTAQELVERATPIAFLTEAGYSLRPLVETVSLIDQRATDWWLGASYVEAFGRVFPNLGDKHRSTADAEPAAPAHWLMSKVASWHWRRGMAFGFSAVAEPYLNFGVPGVILVFMAIGYALAMSDEYLRRGPFLAAFILCSFGSLLWTTRNDFTNFVRPAVWSGIIVGVAKLVDYQLSAHRRKENATDGKGGAGPPGEWRPRGLAAAAGARGEGGTQLQPIVSPGKAGRRWGRRDSQGGT